MASVTKARGICLVSTDSTETISGRKGGNTRLHLKQSLVLNLKLKRTHHKVVRIRISSSWGTVDKQLRWQRGLYSRPGCTAQHALAGSKSDKSKLSPLFTVCLFLSYWDLTGRVRHGQLVIRKSWMPGIPATSADSGMDRASKAVPHRRVFPRWVTLMRRVLVIRWCFSGIQYCEFSGFHRNQFLLVLQEFV